MKKLFVILLLLATSQINADAVIPNIFVAGEAASAEQVNANFTALADAINANASLINENTTQIAEQLTVLEGLIELETKLKARLDNMTPVLKTSNGLSLGTLVSVSGVGDTTTRPRYTVLNSSNNLLEYYVDTTKQNRVSVRGEGVGQVYRGQYFYDSPDCGGNAYLGGGWCQSRRRGGGQ